MGVESIRCRANSATVEVESGILMDNRDLAGPRRNTRLDSTRQRLGRPVRLMSLGNLSLFVEAHRPYSIRRILGIDRTGRQRAQHVSVLPSLESDHSTAFIDLAGVARGWSTDDLDDFIMSHADLDLIESFDASGRAGGKKCKQNQWAHIHDSTISNRHGGLKGTRSQILGLIMF